MRISDWSSDVCSSDLRRGERAAGAQGRREGRLGRRAGRQAAQRSQGDLMSTLIVAEHDNTALKPATLNAVTAAGQLPGETHILIAGAGRSEEHTSELQSLMRISYAVFCLKKKHKQHTRVTRIKIESNVRTQKQKTQL